MAILLAMISILISYLVCWWILHTVDHFINTTHFINDRMRIKQDFEWDGHVEMIADEGHWILPAEGLRSKTLLVKWVQETASLQDSLVLKTSEK